jgi:hypothetical protein
MVVDDFLDLLPNNDLSGVVEFGESSTIVVGDGLGARVEMDDGIPAYLAALLPGGVGLEFAVGRAQQIEAGVLDVAEITGVDLEDFDDFLIRITNGPAAGHESEAVRIPPDSPGSLGSFGLVDDPGSLGSDTTFLVSLWSLEVDEVLRLLPEDGSIAIRVTLEDGSSVTRNIVGIDADTGTFTLERALPDSFDGQDADWTLGRRSATRLDFSIDVIDPNANDGVVDFAELVAAVDPTELITGTLSGEVDLHLHVVTIFFPELEQATQAPQLRTDLAVEWSFLERPIFLAEGGEVFDLADQTAGLSLSVFGDSTGIERPDLTTTPCASSAPAASSPASRPRCTSRRTASSPSTTSRTRALRSSEPSAKTSWATECRASVSRSGWREPARSSSSRGSRRSPTSTTDSRSRSRRPTRTVSSTASRSTSCAPGRRARTVRSPSSGPAT